MIPQEKARELVDKFRDTIDSYRPEEEAIHCALIAVDEIIEALSEYDNRNETFELQNMDRCFSYWEKVKEEIKKL